MTLVVLFLQGIKPPLYPKHNLTVQRVKPRQPPQQRCLQQL